MNHSFIKSALEPAEVPFIQQKCAQCKHSRIDHTSKATCEVCSKISECNIFMTILMCADCELHEKELQEHSKATELERVEQVTSLSYYNARITPIVELKELYELNGKTFHDFHDRIKNQIQHFAEELFKAQVEAKPNEISNLLIEFRAEVRTKIKERDITYIPPAKAPKVNKPKSPLEKAAYKLMEVAESEGRPLTLQEAKAKILKELGL